MQHCLLQHIAVQHQQCSHVIALRRERPQRVCNQSCSSFLDYRRNVNCTLMPARHDHYVCTSEDATPTLMCLRSIFMPRDFANWMSDTRALSVGAV